MLTWAIVYMKTGGIDIPNGILALAIIADVAICGSIAQIFWK